MRSGRLLICAWRHPFPFPAWNKNDEEILNVAKIALLLLLGLFSLLLFEASFGGKRPRAKDAG